MKWLLIVVLLFAACDEYTDPTVEEMTELFGQCGTYCLDEECLDFFEDVPCVDVGYHGTCKGGRCWMDWDATCERGEPIPWP
jgi:hypothetical protein